MRQQHFDLMNQLVTLKGEQTKQPSTLEQVKQMGNNLNFRERHSAGYIDGTMAAGSRRYCSQSCRHGRKTSVHERVESAYVSAGHSFAAWRCTANRTAAGAPTAPSANAAPENRAAQNPIPEMDIMTKTLFIAIADNAAAALKLGIAGDEFAERLCDNFGPRTYDNFIEQNAKETLLPLFASIPEAWTLLQPFEPAIANSSMNFTPTPTNSQMKKLHRLSLHQPQRQPRPKRRPRQTGRQNERLLCPLSHDSPRHSDDHPAEAHPDRRATAYVDDCGRE